MYRQHGCEFGLRTPHEERKEKRKEEEFAMMCDDIYVDVLGRKRISVCRPISESDPRIWFGILLIRSDFEGKTKKFYVQLFPSSSFPSNRLVMRVYGHRISVFY